MGETEKIAKMAEEVSANLLSFFKWQYIPLYNTNFDCKKPKEHSNVENYTHPVDVVFHYLDPYTGMRVLLNTDLKSYASGSIKENQVRQALRSLAKAIDCARLSKQWNDRFGDFEEPKDIRGLLFTYNHTGDYDKEFYQRFFTKKKGENKRVINPSSLPLKKNQQLHIIEPVQIVFLNTLMNDINGLVSNRKFPFPEDGKHWFFYPELYLHKTHFSRYERAATIEMLSSPFIIIGHDDVLDNQNNVREPAGYIVYYNGKGETTDEFVYLLDTLSRNQLLDSDLKISVRCTHRHKSPDITTQFKKAVQEYQAAWGFDQYKAKRLSEIESEFATITQYKEILTEIDVGWRSHS